MVQVPHTPRRNRYVVVISLVEFRRYVGDVRINFLKAVIKVGISVPICGAEKIFVANFDV